MLLGWSMRNVFSGMIVDRSFLEDHDGGDMVQYEVIAEPSPVQFRGPQGMRFMLFQALREHIFAAMDAGAQVGVVNLNEDALLMVVEGADGGKFQFMLKGLGYGLLSGA